MSFEGGFQNLTVDADAIAIVILQKGFEDSLVGDLLSRDFDVGNGITIYNRSCQFATHFRIQKIVERVKSCNADQDEDCASED